MRSFLAATLVLSTAAMLCAPAAAQAADAGFAFKVARRNVTADPDGIWTGSALEGGDVSIFEYELPTPQGTLLVSQIWNQDCASNTCPTRLVRIGPGGRRTVLVDDMMRQVIPPDDQRFAGLAKGAAQAAYAQNPFRLSGDGKTLLNGDFKFEVGEGAP